MCIYESIAKKTQVKSILFLEENVSKKYIFFGRKLSKKITNNSTDTHNIIF